jgi:hypothetical protein
MSSLKKFVREEVNSALKKESARIKFREMQKNLYEAVNTMGSLKKKTMESKNASELKRNYKKYKIAKKITEQIESKLSSAYRKFEGQEEGEDKMMKAQLLSIMENAERIYHMIEDGEMFEDWLQYKVTIAEDYLRAVSGYLKYYNGENNMKDDYELDSDDDLDYDDSELDDEDWDDDFDDIEEDELDYEDEGWDDEDFSDLEDDEDFDDE